jgi:hypothetical protein
MEEVLRHHGDGMLKRRKMNRRTTTTKNISSLENGCCAERDVYDTDLILRVFSVPFPW